MSIFVGVSAISGFYTGEIYGFLGFLERGKATKTERDSEKVDVIGVRGYFWMTEKVGSNLLSVF